MDSEFSPSEKLLVVDDEPEIVAFIRDLLVTHGYQVLGLSDTREVPDTFDQFRPDACIFDFRMPHRTGADLLDIVKAKDPRVEVIFVTAQDEASLAVEMMKRGAMDFLLKPVELNQLLLSVGRARTDDGLTMLVLSAIALIMAMARAMLDKQAPNYKIFFV